MNTAVYDYSQDNIPVGDNLLAVISQMAQEAIESAAKVEAAENALKLAKDVHKDIVQRRLPELMIEAGQKSGLVTSGGLRIDLKEVLRASIPEATADEALTWLEEHNAGSVVKNTLKAEFGKGEIALNQMKSILETLNLLNVPCDTKRGVHVQTLQATLKELLADGVDVPLEIFGAIVQKECTVKPVKK